MTQLTPQQLAVAERLMSILYPYALRRRKAVVERNGRFVHYTSAESELSIIGGKCIWMRNATCMSDYREVHHGYDALTRYFANTANREAFLAAVNGCSAGIAEETIAQFDQSRQNTQLQTYITSISKHDDREDFHGRLSMWRGFGSSSSARVALVIKLDLDIGEMSRLVQS